MKISAIKKVMKRAKQVIIYETCGCQWIGTEDACYKADGVTINAKGISSLLDISKEKLETMDVRTVDMATSGMEPAQGYEGAEIELLMPVWWGRLYRPIRVGEYLYVLDVEKLEAAQTDSGILCFQMHRNEAGDPLVILSDGPRVTGIVRPESVNMVETVMDQARQVLSLAIGPVYRDGAAQISTSEVMEDDGDTD